MPQTTTPNFYFHMPGQTISRVTPEGGTQSPQGMPRLNLQMGYTRTFNIADYGTLSATVDTNYKTEYYNGIETNLAGARVPSHHLSNFYMSWASPKGMFSASANVKNIENKAVAMAAIGGNVMLNSPRTYSASLTVKF